jgi:class 3 adenylate cyclase
MHSFFASVVVFHEFISFVVIPSMDIDSNNDSRLGFNRIRSFLKRLCSKEVRVSEIVSRKPGIVSPDAVRWFVERDSRTLAQSVSFVPNIIRTGIKEGFVSDSTSNVVVFRGQGAVVFCDASGFTKLTEYLAQKPNGAELLSRVMNEFFTPLIDIIGAYRGDIIKFSGDALTILFAAQTEQLDPEEVACGSAWAHCPGHSDLELALLRACACCIEIHKKLDNFDTGFSDKKLSFHIGIGCGSCTVLHVGGGSAPEDRRTSRFEYVLTGEPLEQIAHACKYAEIYETVLSPQAWDLVRNTVFEGEEISADPCYKRLAGFDASKHTYATIRAAADPRTPSHEFQISDLVFTRRYIPSAVYQQMANGTLEYVNEIRTVTVFFICVSGGLDVSTPSGAVTAQDLMSSVQEACFQQEGQVNKFLVDDKGLLFLCVFGTPPLVHTDDPFRAISACFSIIQSLKRLGLEGNIGLATGRVFCGLVGSNARQEYTTLGDCVNLAARLMQLGHINMVIADEAAYLQTKDELDYQTMEPVKLKGKDGLIKIFRPEPRILAGVAPVDVKLKRRTTNIGDILEPSAFAGDPLVYCNHWRELKQTKRCIEESGLIRNGGTLVLGGASGLGKDQISKYVISTARAVHSDGIATVYSTDRGLPRDRARPLVEFLETCLAAAIACGLGDQCLNKLELLGKLINEPLEKIQEGAELIDNLIDMPLLNSYSAGIMADQAPAISIGNPAMSPFNRRRKLSRFLSLTEDGSRKLSAREMLVPFEDQFIDYCERLVKRVLQDRPVVAVLRISRGTSLFNIVNNPTFWKLVKRISALSFTGNSNPLAVLVLSRRADDAGFLSGHVQRIEMQALTRNCLEEYMGKILQVDENELPGGLVDFVEELTQGNALYVLETLEQLVAKGYVSRTPEGVVSVHEPDLKEKVSVSDWSHTAMVGRVVCQLEALAPQEAAIVKMASVFQGPFSVLDIAASLKSPYLQAQRFDNYRMYRTCARLVQLGILSAIPQDTSSEVPINDLSRFPQDTDRKFLDHMRSIPMFILDDLLIRKVAGGMVLHQQALKIKRQALMHRVIFRDVPDRLAAHRARMETLHTPYYNLVKLG